MENRNDDDLAPKPLFSEFTDDTMPQSQPLFQERSVKVMKVKRKREKTRRKEDDSGESSQSDEDKELDENSEEESNLQEKEAEQIPAWLRYLPPRRFIKVKNQKNTSTATTVMDSDFNAMKDDMQLKPEHQQRKRMKYNSHTATEAAALLSFFTLKKEDEQ